MTSRFVSIDLGQLRSVTGGADAPTAPPQPPPPQPQPQPGSNTQWMQNAASCARIGGPVLGAICGAMTPTPAY
jgi:hypothetical protein